MNNFSFLTLLAIMQFVYVLFLNFKHMNMIEPSAYQMLLSQDFLGTQTIIFVILMCADVIYSKIKEVK